MTAVRPISAIALVAVLQFPLFGDTWFAADTVKHFFFTAFTQSVVYASARASGMERRDALRASIGIAAGAGLAREVYDARVKGRFSVPDLVWDAAGVAATTEMLRRTR